MRMGWMVATILFIAVGFFSSANSGALDDGFFVLKEVDCDSVVFNVEGTLIDIDQIGNGRYLVSIGGERNDIGLRTFSIYLYDASSGEFSNGVRVENTFACKIRKSQDSNLFVLVHGYEEANSTIVSILGNHLIEEEYFGGAELVAADQNLLGMAFYDPAMQSGKFSPGSGLAFGVLPRPGPFAGCNVSQDGIYGGVYFLSREFAVVYWVDGSTQNVFRLNPDCSIGWRISLPALVNVLDIGRVGDDQLLVYNSSKGAFGLSLKSGKMTNLGIEKGGVLDVAFLDDSLVYSCINKTSRSENGKEFILRRIDKSGKTLGVFPLPFGRQTSKMEVVQGILVCHVYSANNDIVTNTVLYSGGLDSAVLINGYWTVVGVDDEGVMAQLLGEAGGCTGLCLGSILLK